MQDTFIQNCIDEFREMQRQRPPEQKQSVLETALFLEDTFGILLEDSELDEEHLGPETDLMSLVKAKMAEG